MLRRAVIAFESLPELNVPPYHRKETLEIRIMDTQLQQ
jgi:hypothetical protein